MYRFFLFLAVGLYTILFFPASPALAQSPTFSPTGSLNQCLEARVVINPQQEGGVITSSAAGAATVRVRPGTNAVEYKIVYTGLSAAETAAHIHGFAPRGQSAGILHTLPSGTTKQGQWQYGDAQEQGILGGSSYINIHSTNYPNGEIRGQIDQATLVNCSAALPDPVIPTSTQPLPTPSSTHTPGPACNKSFPIQFSCYGDWYSAYHAGGNQTSGDFNGDGIASLADFETWRRLFIDSNSPSPTPVAPTITPTVTPPSTGCTYPAQKLNLTNWKVTLPTGSSSSPTEIKQPQLATFTVDPWFKVNANCTGVQFRAHTSGVTTSGSGYPRSELREMANNGTANAAWTNASGTHTMTIDQAIIRLPTTKNHVVAGQIHDSNDDVTVIRLEGNTLYSTLGNTTHAQVVDSNYSLGTRFQVKFVATGGKILIYYKANGAADFVLKHTINQTISGSYFKAGAYTQSNCSTESSCGTTNYGEVHIYNLQVQHQ